MPTLKDVCDFLYSYKFETSRDLDISKIVKSFLEAFPDCDFQTEMEKWNQCQDFLTVKSVSEYVEKVCFGFNDPIRQMYEKCEKEAKDRIKHYKQIVSDLNQRIQVVPASQKYYKQKLIYFKDINTKLYEMAKEDRKKEKLLGTAISICRNNKNHYFWPIIDESRKYYDYRQYEDFDIRKVINFGEMPIPETEKLMKLKNVDIGKYAEGFIQYIREYHIIENTMEIIKKSPELNNRFSLFETAYELFNSSKFDAFVYLIVPQIEGLFVEYSKQLEITDIENYFSITEKLQKVNEKQSFWGYVYYSFDFPEKRNPIAHGSIVPISEIDAYELVCDVYYIVHHLICEKTNPK